MFRNVHAMVQHSRPLGDYVWMCELDEMKGVQLGTTYCNQKFANVLKKAKKNSKFSWGGGGMPPNPLACSDHFTVLTGDTWALTFTPGLPDFYILGPRWLLPIKVIFCPCDYTTNVVSLNPAQGFSIM